MTTDIAERIRTINSEIAAEFVERDEHIGMLSLALLARQHVYYVGDPGVAKSEMVQAWCQRITGANYWRILMDRQLPPEALVGPVDLLQLRDSGDFRHRIDGFLPTAHIAFLDEVEKAGAVVTNQLLTILNERIYRNGREQVNVPLITAVAASNNVLDVEQEAIWDRWLIRMVVDDVAEPANMIALLSGLEPAGNTTISLDELATAQAQVQLVDVPVDLIQSLVHLRNDLHTEGIRPSARRWAWSLDLVRAYAWMRGDTTATSSDLEPLCHTLWINRDQVSTVASKVYGLIDPSITGVLAIKQQVWELRTEIDTALGLPTEEERLQAGIQLRAEARELHKQLQALKDDVEDMKTWKDVERSIDLGIDLINTSLFGKGAS